MKNFKNIFLSTIIPAIAMVLSLGFSLNPTGCKSFSSGGNLEILEGDFSLPKLESFSVLSDRQILLLFSKEVSLQSAAMQSEDGEQLLLQENAENEQTNSLLVEFAEATEIGKKYIFDVSAFDKNGNSVSLSINFSGFNSNPAKLIFSEIRNAYGTAKVDGNSVHKSEFAEFYVLKSGNLSGFEIYSAVDGDEKKYEFPAVEVKAGDYITVHMRKINADGIDGEGMISELEEDLSLSTHIDSCSSARDLWSSNEKSVFGNTDIIVLRDSASKEIFDSFLCAPSTENSWPTDEIKNLAEEVLTSGTWKNSTGDFSAGIETAVCSDNITSSACTRSYSRQNLAEVISFYSENPDSKITSCASDYLITADKGSGSKKIYGVTPGYENSSNAYGS